MSEDNLIDNSFDYEIYSIEREAISVIYKKYEKVISKIYKKILKQAKKNPFKNYYEINISKYSPNEMRAIKLFFVDWLGFKFSRTIPKDEMKEIVHSLSVGTVISSKDCITTSYAVKEVPIEKFYIVWF